MAVRYKVIKEYKHFDLVQVYVDGKPAYVTCKNKIVKTPQPDKSRAQRNLDGVTFVY